MAIDLELYIANLDHKATEYKGFQQVGEYQQLLNKKSVKSQYKYNKILLKQTYVSDSNEQMDFQYKKVCSYKLDYG